jgi:AcrR family transcriptional regulator
VTPDEITNCACLAAPSAQRREDRREAILDVAQACFLGGGYEATSMSEIAARLGGSKATLYNYFRSKEALFDAVARRFCARWPAELESIGPALGLRDFLIELAERFLLHVLSAEGVALQRLVISEGGRFPELAELFYAVGPSVGDLRLSEIFADLMAEGRLRPCAPSLAVQHFKGLVLSGTLLKLLWHRQETIAEDEKRRQAAAAVDSFMRAYSL